MIYASDLHSDVDDDRLIIVFSCLFVFIFGRVIVFFLLSFQFSGSPGKDCPTLSPCHEREVNHERKNK